METGSLDDLIERCSTKPFDYYAFETLGYGSHEELCLAFSTRVAQGFATGRFSFNVADAAVNRLYSYAYHQSDLGMPDFSWRVFEAIEQGEYQHRGDAPEVDPVEKYVVPSVFELLAHSVRV